MDVLNSEYVLFARARGEGKWTILRRHGLRNILLPALTLQFASFAELFGGSVMAENVFSYPGLGSAVAAAGLNSDVPLLLGVTLFSALFVETNPIPLKTAMKFMKLDSGQMRLPLTEASTRTRNIVDEVIG